MKRCALALLGLLALPLSAAAAQDRSLLTGEPPPERLPESRFSVTPYVGVRIPFTTGDIALVDEDGNQYLLAYQRGGGPMAGIDVSARIRGPIHFIAGGAYSAGREDVLRLADAAGDSLDERRTDGPAFWFARAGVQVRLADPTPDNRRFHPSALVTVAPALVFTSWGDDNGFPDEANEGSTAFALNVGADAAARIGRSDRWSFSVGLHDYIAFWNNDDFAVRDAYVGEVLLGTPVGASYGSSTSHLLTARFGVSYRFR
jgi:hypothetical protein